jgi:hypothetical protein
MRHRKEGSPPPELKECGDPRLFMYPLCVADGVVIADGGVFDAATGKPMPWPKTPGSHGQRNATCPLRWVCDGQEYFIIGNTCLKPKTGEVVWRIKEGGRGTPAIRGGDLVADMGKDGFSCFKIDAKGYKPVWNLKDYTKSDAVAATGVICDGWFFAEAAGPSGPGGGRRSAEITERAIGIELATGKVAGPVNFAGIVQSLCTSPVGTDGRWFFLVGSGNSGIVMMNTDPAGFKQIGLRMPTVCSPKDFPWGTKAKDRLDYCHTSTPAIVDGRMYFRGSDCLWCYDLRKP